MTRIRSFPPVADEHATILILGSMPGQRSLDKHEYYALPQNAFWKIIDNILGTKPDYENRLSALKKAGIALWDVLHTCERKGSSDSEIRKETPNDFASFFAQHPRITHVFFNGSKAEQSFNKFVMGKQKLPLLEFVRLPSTSPAHAGMRYDEKLKVWRETISSRG
jgi:hypoxanthine-DNA glycosylase